MGNQHNVNETNANVKKNLRTRNDIVNDNYNVPNKYDRSKRVDMIADQLIEKLGNKEFRGFYCKVAWKLSEARIWDNYETAKAASDAKNSHPGKLFTYLCKRDGV